MGLEPGPERREEYTGGKSLLFDFVSEGLL
jgi:hypothetical protein